MSEMITKDTNPWRFPEAMTAAAFAFIHDNARARWNGNKSSQNSIALVNAHSVRDGHQTKTGWSAHHLGNGKWKFYYLDPAEREAGGTAVTIETTEDAR